MIKLSILALALGAVATTLMAGHGQKSSSSNDRYEKETRRIDRSVNARNTQRLKVRVPFGSVSLVSTNGSEVTVHATRSVRKPATDRARKWLDDSKLNAESRGDEILIEELPFGKRWTNSSNHNDNEMRGMDHIDLDIEVGVPASLDVDLEVMAGTAEAKGRFKSLRYDLMAGDMKLHSVTCDGRLSLNNKAGEITADLNSVPGKDSSIYVGAGQADIRLPRSANAIVSAKSSMGEISGLPAGRRSGEGIHLSDSRTAKFGRGGIKLNVEVGVGSITFNGGGSAELMSVQTSKDEEDVEDKDEDKHTNEFMSEKDMKDFDQLKHLDVDKVIQQAMKEANAEVAKALKDADKEVAKALKDAEKELANSQSEMKRENFIDEKALSNEIRAAVRSALKAARESIAAAKKATESIRKHGHTSSFDFDFDFGIDKVQEF